MTEVTKLTKTGLGISGRELKAITFDKNKKPELYLVLQLNNLNGFEIGDEFIFGGLTFHICNPHEAVCTQLIDDADNYTYEDMLWITFKWFHSNNNAML